MSKKRKLKKQAKRAQERIAELKKKQQQAAKPQEPKAEKKSWVRRFFGGAAHRAVAAGKAVIKDQGETPKKISKAVFQWGKTIILVGVFAAGAALGIKSCVRIIPALDDTGLDRRPGETKVEHHQRLKEQGGIIEAATETEEAIEEGIKALDDREYNKRPDESQEDYLKRLEKEGNGAVRTAAGINRWLKSKTQPAPAPQQGKKSAPRQATPPTRQPSQYE